MKRFHVQYIDGQKSISLKASLLHNRQAGPPAVTQRTSRAIHLFMFRNDESCKKISPFSFLPKKISRTDAYRIELLSQLNTVCWLVSHLLPHTFMPVQRGRIPSNSFNRFGIAVAKHPTLTSDLKSSDVSYFFITTSFVWLIKLTTIGSSAGTDLCGLD